MKSTRSLILGVNEFFLTQKHKVPFSVCVLHATPSCRKGQFG